MLVYTKLKIIELSPDICIIVKYQIKNQDDKQQF